MNWYLLTWNPKHDGGESLKALYKKLQKTGRPVKDNWSCGNTTRIRPGDGFLLVKLGAGEDSGLVASGKAEAEPWTGPHWNDPSKTAVYVDLLYELMIDPMAAGDATFPLRRLRSLASSYDWTPQRGGVSIPREVAQKVATAWAAHCATQSARSTRTDEPGRRRLDPKLPSNPAGLPGPVIYVRHNHQDSRRALQHLRRLGFEPDVRDIEEFPPPRSVFQVHMDARHVLAYLDPTARTFRRHRLQEDPPTKRGAIELMVADPRLIKSPVVVAGTFACFGFDAEFLDSLKEDLVHEAPSVPDVDEGPVEYQEGMSRVREVELISRSSAARAAAIARQGGRPHCEICGFDFAATYPGLGQGFIEVHHLEPVGRARGRRQVTPDELLPICANCHRMIHRNREVTLSPQELRAILKKSVRTK